MRSKKSISTTLRLYPCCKEKKNKSRFNNEKMITLNKTAIHPNFILGAFSFLLLLLGVVLRSDDFMIGDYLKLAGITCGAVHWIWSMIDVFTNHELNSKSRPFWTILVVLIPPLGGMFYYMNGRTNIGL